MTPDEITDETASRYVKAVGGEGLYIADTHEERMAIAKLEIAAAINAVTPPDNDDPITPEWLDTIYVKSGPCWISPRTDDPTKPMLRILTPASIVMFPCQSDEWGSGISVSFETRGQLRAWHVAHRQPLKEVQS